MVCGVLKLDLTKYIIVFSLSGVRFYSHESYNILSPNHKDLVV